mgnify:CR=1 FL=1
MFGCPVRLAFLCVSTLLVVVFAAAPASAAAAGLLAGAAHLDEVEARDRDGNVLAEATFTCTPAAD